MYSYNIIDNLYNIIGIRLYIIYNVSRGDLRLRVPEIEVAGGTVDETLPRFVNIRFWD